VTQKEQVLVKLLLVQLTLKENKMNKLIVALMATFAVTAFAQDKGKGEPVAVKTTPNAVVAPAAEPAKKPEVKKEAKPSKSTPAKDEKAAAPATKPASK
jgi:hypothetical protein